MKVEVEVKFSKQAMLLIESMPGVSVEDIYQHLKEEGVHVGGQDVISYLEKKKGVVHG